MANLPTVLGGRNLQNTIPVITGPLLNLAKIGLIGQALVEVTFALTNTDTTIPHTLGRVPNGYILYRKTQYGDIQDASDGSGSWTGTAIVLQASVAGVYWLLLI